MNNKFNNIQEIENEYIRCYDILNRSGILSLLTNSNSVGVIGIDGNEYPIPTKEQVIELFENNDALVSEKIAQGFNQMELTPMAMSLPNLFDLLKSLIIRYSIEGNIYQTRCRAIDPFVPVRINSEKQVWIWDTLKQAIETEEIVYFPRNYSANHQGLIKLDVINNSRFCAVPGWSVGLVESYAKMSEQGLGERLGGRRQLDIGNSPREYLQILESDVYNGETGKTLEDFIIKFITRLEEKNEVSNDRYDNNSMWCLGQYIKIKYGECVPTGWWNRDFGRLRIDMHRTGNKVCTKSWGASTTVRLVGV
ncbi:MAG: hypothetical protein WCR42_10695 [bacterium]